MSTANINFKRIRRLKLFLGSICVTCGLIIGVCAIAQQSFALGIFLLAGMSGILWVTVQSILILHQFLHAPIRVEVLIRDLFGRHWTAPVLLYHDGRIQPADVVDCELTPFDGDTRTAGLLGAPPYLKQYMRDSDQEKLPLGVLMLGQLYTLPPRIMGSGRRRR